MIDHLTLTVRDLATSRAFYTRALAPLGYTVTMEFGGFVAYGAAKPVFWLKQGDPPTRPSLHLAFAAASREQVDEFHAAALAAGGLDNGAPGLRTDYHPDYYGAFVFDPDGHNLEAVSHASARPPRRTAPRRAPQKKPSPRPRRGQRRR